MFACEQGRGRAGAAGHVHHPLSRRELGELGEAQGQALAAGVQLAVEQPLGDVDLMQPGTAGLRVTFKVEDSELDVHASAPRTCSRYARNGTRMVGVDLGAQTIERAERAARAAGLAERVRFVHGDAEALPLADATFDVALSECSLCTFPDKARAVAEMARVLRPGGTIAVADVVASLDALPAPLRTAAARVACVADARTEDEYAALLRGAGCETIAIERRDADLLAMVDRVEARLRVARMLVPDGEQRDRVREAVALARMARDEIGHGNLGYALIVARRGS